MAVTTRQGLKDYALRALGAPVIEINVAEEQLEDRIDEALDYFNINHWDGSERAFLQHKVVGSTLTFSSGSGTSFVDGETITGNTSGVFSTVQKNTRTATTLQYDYSRKITNNLKEKAPFVVGETIVGAQSGATAIIGSITLGDIENRYIPIPDSTYGVNKVYSLYSGSSTMKNIFDLQYQLRLNDLYDLTATSVVYYTTVMNHLQMLDTLLNGSVLYRFNRLSNRLYIDMDWGFEAQVGDYILVDTYKAMDPTTFQRVYNEPWLKKYVTALFKMQWGANLKKFSGLSLPGGVSIDGDGIYNEAMNEKNALEDELTGKAAPLEFFVG